MLFNSFTFFALLVPTVACYWLSESQVVRLAVLFASSLFFYGFYHWPSLFILLGTIACNYGLARLQQARRSRGLLALVVTLNLLLLGYFKYAAFVMGELERLFIALGLHLSLPHPTVALPLGISFFTFQVIAYQIDVYRRQIEAERSPLVFAVFKSFFAQLIAGPIVRASEFLPQLRTLRSFDAVRFQRGLFLLVAGLFLKIGVADVLRQFADQAFATVATETTSDAWLGLVAFAFQLFADFWGYSTMAIGLGLLFGLDLPLNFDLPYLATSLQDFWRRWHITLSNWFRDYLYIPLGGNRRLPLFNLFLTMTIAGIWHGAGWNFVLWGALHGLWLAAERVFRRRWSLPLPRAVKTLLVFIGVCLCWVPFRAPTFAVTLAFYKRLLLPPYTGNNIVPETLPIWLVAFALLHPILAKLMRAETFPKLAVSWQVAVSAALLVLTLAYGGQKYDFVYFAF